LIRGLRVVDLSTEIAGPYCTKLLADGGADVVKVESDEGDPMRSWTASGAKLGDDDGALFRFLNTSKRSVVGELGDGAVDELVAAADLVVESSMPAGVDVGALHRANPELTVLSISPFGRRGPWSDRPATEFTLQAWCGSTGGRGVPDGPPLHAGGRLGEWVGGAYAAVAAVAGVVRSRRRGRGEHVDLSLLECMCLSMNTYAPLFASFTGWKPASGPARTVELPSIEPTADGYVGFCTITGQQFRDFLVLIERPDLLDDADLASAPGRTRRMHEFLDAVHPWTRRHTTNEIIDLATLLRIPVAPIGTGETVTDFEHFRERGTFVTNPGADFVQPRVPYRIGDAPRVGFRPAPALGEHTGSARWPAREAGPKTEPLAHQRRWPAREAGPKTEPLAHQRQWPAREAARGAESARPNGSPDPLPLEGVRVLDFTAFWAGPAATHMLAALGADVIKVESIQRPDGMRFTTTARPSTDRWWDWAPVFNGANAGKRGVTLDMTRPDGVSLAKRLVAWADAVVENFSPRVMEGFGLDWEAVAAANPRAIMVRMPAFGLTGPWRDRTGFAQTMEQVSGMAWVTGLPDGPPLIPRGTCDPMAGMHAVLALMVALDERDRTGKATLVEMTMVEAALNAAAEQVVERSAYGAALHRDANRGPVAAPQGVYACRGDEQWVALAVATDDQWLGLRRAMGEPTWAAHPALASAAGRRGAHDGLDEELAQWCSDHDRDEVVELLADHGVPAAPVLAPREIAHNPQMRARGFFETIDHPVVGTHALPGLPFRLSDRRAGWLRLPPPTLGQHNDEVLRDVLGLDDDEIGALRSDGIIGDRPVGA
jgi:crotonobetainyl-CoA:carnitine CoA-transferase CaiB-like acyl-CoA transferase